METTVDDFTKYEVQLAFRNKGMPLEGLHYDVTPGSAICIHASDFNLQVGMHYNLIHFDVPVMDEKKFALVVDGSVKKKILLTLDQIKKMPKTSLVVTLECAGNGRALLKPRTKSQPWLNEGIGTSKWTGTRLRPILESAGIKDSAVEILFTGADRGIQGGVEHDYQRSLSITDAMRDEVMLAYEMNDKPLEPHHGLLHVLPSDCLLETGFPLRLVVPGFYGMASVKWLVRIEAIDKPFDGVQMKAYELKQTAEGRGEPVKTIKVRALMIPPGIPEFKTRDRLLREGLVTLRGRAWAGRTPVAKVEVSTDNGSSWSDAKLEEHVSPFAWRGWHFPWKAAVGKHTLIVRATDANGDSQPLQQPWNIIGLCNNMVQKVVVAVVPVDNRSKM